MEIVIELIGGEDLELLAGFDHDAGTFPANEVDSPVRGDGGGINVTQIRNTGAGDHLGAVFRCEAGEDALIGLGEVKLPVIEHSGRYVGGAAVGFPTDLIGDVAAAGDRNGKQRVTLIAGHAVDGGAALGGVIHDGAGRAVIGQSGRLPD